MGDAALARICLGASHQIVSFRVIIPLFDDRDHTAKPDPSVVAGAVSVDELGYTQYLLKV